MSNTSNKPTKVMSLYNRVTKLPFGNKIFSKMVNRMAPYFATVKPMISELNVNLCVLNQKT